MASRDPVADLRRIAFLLEAAHEATFRVKAFRSAAAVLGALDPAELRTRVENGTLGDLKGVGDVTVRCVAESLAGEEPVYLRRLAATEGTNPSESALRLRDALRGDCHSHSDWSDGGSPIEEMALGAVEVGHEYLVLTDHSPRLKVARGLTPARLRRQLDHVATVNAQLPDGFRILTGIEVDINPDGTLDQEDELLARLDVVVGSVHSELRADEAVMTRRMLKAVANPHLDILGHCTGRRLPTKNNDRAHARTSSRPPSDFDAKRVFAAAAEHGKAIEINCRPDRLDPPKRLLRLAIEAGCLFAIDTDAHAPGQLDWQRYGCERAAMCGVPVDRVVNTWSAEELTRWAGGH
jgi:putative hydrolase